MARMATASTHLNATLEEDLRRVEIELGHVGHDADWVLRDAIRHHLRTGGKRMRPRLALLAGRLVGGVTSDGLVQLAAVTELVHAASLVHDDTLDEAGTRRGVATVSSQWGDHIAVLVGDYLFAQAAILTAGLGSLRLMGLLAETIQSLVQGELAQMDAAYRIEASALNYEMRIAAKTASLFILAAEGGAVYVGTNDEQARALSGYAYNLGLAFQIADDVLDYTGSMEELGKPARSDLASGVVTLPALYYLQELPADAPDYMTVEEGGDVTTVVAAIRASDAPARALARARELARDATNALMVFPPSSERDALIALAGATVSRGS
jgi:all-trans-nonaprenyl-diphosphate synthase